MPLYELSSEAEEATQLPSPPADAPHPSDYGLEETLNIDNSSPTPPVQNYNFDPDFYFSGGFVIFEVEDYLFRVPTYIFAKESNYFITEFNILAEDNFEFERTIVLPSDVRRDDFRTLLKVLYPSFVSTTSLSLTVPEWGSLLKLSTQWKFENLREMAIAHLTSLPSVSFQPLDKIILGRQCSVPAWFLDGLREIVLREQTISDDDAIKMGHITAFRLSRLREMKLKRPRQWNGHYYTEYTDNWITEDIQHTFAAELVSIKAEEQLLKPKSDDYPSTSSKKKKGRRK